MCVDYRRLISVTKFDCFPLPDSMNRSMRYFIEFVIYLNRLMDSLN